MNQPIEIRKNIVNGQEIQTVNARELHAFLESKQDFSTWVKGRIDQYGFTEGEDFTLHKFVERGTTKIDYHISVDMAKELAMVERNDRGKQARQYFIECERRAKSAVANLPDFTNPAAAARAWADEVEAKQTALTQLEAARPAVTFVDKYVDSTGLKSFREVCKILHANESRFREFLADRRIMYRLNGAWTAYQTHIDAGRLLVKTGVSQHNGHAFTDVKFTPKGVNWIAGEWGKYQLQGEVA